MNFKPAPVTMVRVINRDNKSIKMVPMNRAMRRRLGIKRVKRK